MNQGAGRFRANVDYRTGREPYSVAIGDLNGDAKLDLVAANAGPDEDPGKTVSVLLNRGDGSFLSERKFRTGYGPGSVAIGDLNGDGKPDLATADTRAHAVSVLTNTGEGTFRTRKDYWRGGHAPISIAIGDLNGDGRLDLATGNERMHTLSALVNRGHAGFRDRVDYLPGPSAPVSAAIGDLNGDGKPDLVAANDLASSVSVLINTRALCNVQFVKGKTLRVTKRRLARAHCGVGKIRRVYSRDLKWGHVISQKPRLGAVLPGGGKVNLVVSRGRRRL
jgi:hypothetical protein